MQLATLALVGVLAFPFVALSSAVSTALATTAPVGAATATPVAAAAATPTGPQDEAAAAPHRVADAADLRELSVRILDVAAVSKHFSGSLVTLEVKNDGATWVEPLAFELQPKGKVALPIHVARVLPPVFGRAGRVLAPRKKERFVVQVRQSPNELAGAKAAVTMATVHTAATAALAADEVVEVGRERVEDVLDAERNQRLPRTFVPVRNLRDEPIDVTLRIEVTGRFPAEALVRERLAPRESRDLVVRELTFPIDDQGSSASTSGAPTKKVALVDWSVVADDGAAFARAALEAAFATWVRAAPERFPVQAPFTAHGVLHGLFRQLGERFDVDETVVGTITVRADGSFELLDADGAAIESPIEREVRATIERAVVHMARPTLDALPPDARIALLSAGARTDVQVDGAERLFGSKSARLVLADGRIVASGWLGEHDDALEVWAAATDSTPARWSVREVASTNPLQGWQRLSVRTARGADAGLLVRVERATEGKLLDDPTSVVVTFGSWSSAAEVAPLPAPQGPLADVLRAAWDGFHRHPDPARTVRGSYTIVTPATDGVWLGRARVEGTFELSGMEGLFWRRSQTTVADAKLAADERDLLVNAVEDRYLMWSGIDLCRRPRFDVDFAGASLAAGADGWILVERGPFEGVLVADGRVLALANTGGGETRLRWVELDGALLPTQYVMGSVEARFEWANVGDGWFWPRRCDFIGNFGPDWGPEKLTFDVDAIE